MRITLGSETASIRLPYKAPGRREADIGWAQHAGRKGELSMSERTSFTVDEARSIGESIGIDWASCPFDVEQFRMGMDVELEHGLHDLSTNVTDSDPVVTGKIALAHLNEFPDYYTRLRRMEEEAKRAHSR
jgi:Protein of unknown function (DUF5661)